MRTTETTPTSIFQPSSFPCRVFGTPGWPQSREHHELHLYSQLSGWRYNQQATQQKDLNSSFASKFIKHEEPSTFLSFGCGGQRASLPHRTASARNHGGPQHCRCFCFYVVSRVFRSSTWLVDQVEYFSEWCTHTRSNYLATLYLSCLWIASPN